MCAELRSWRKEKKFGNGVHGWFRRTETPGRIVRVIAEPAGREASNTRWRSREASGGEASKQLDSVKHLLSHGNVEEALQRLGNLFLDLDLIRKRSARRRSWQPAEFQTYIRNNRESIPNYGERYRQGETRSALSDRRSTRW